VCMIYIPSFMKNDTYRRSRNIKVSRQQFEREVVILVLLMGEIYEVHH
jgi:hypothetical protein